MMVTIRSSSSDVISPALYPRCQYAEVPGRGRVNAHRLFKSTSAFLHTKLE